MEIKSENNNSRKKQLINESKAKKIRKFDENMSTEKTILKNK